MERSRDLHILRRWKFHGREDFCHWRRTVTPALRAWNASWVVRARLLVTNAKPRRYMGCLNLRHGQLRTMPMRYSYG
jgi:hypothetical protein